MKKMILFLLLSLLIPSTWQEINSSVPTPINAELISSDINNTKIKNSIIASNSIISKQTVNSEEKIFLLGEGTRIIL